MQEVAGSSPASSISPAAEYLGLMSRAATLLAALTDEPASTSDVYDRVGYVNLVRVGLVPYAAFRAELDRLAATGLVQAHSAPDGSTLWRLATPRRGPGP
jgi:hypothetical protein